jgi:hypothetical protein
MNVLPAAARLVSSSRGGGATRRPREESVAAPCKVVESEVGGLSPCKVVESEVLGALAGSRRPEQRLEALRLQSCPRPPQPPPRPSDNPLPRAAAPRRRAGAPGRGGDASRECLDGCRLVASGLERRTKLKAPLRVGLRLEQPLAPPRAWRAARTARARRAWPRARRGGRGERRAEVEARELRHRAQLVPGHNIHAPRCQLLPRLPPRPALRVGARACAGPLTRAAALTRMGP